MKTTKTFEIEIQRHNVTPGQFLAYLRSMQKKHPEMANDFNLDQFAAESWSVSYTNALPSEKPCNAERVTDKPFNKQTYIRNFDGTTYNEIIEFDFDDEKTGHGYYYTVQIDVADEDREANTAETVAATIRRRSEKADHQEAKAAKIEAEADDAERRGYTSKWWIDSKRTEAATLRREATATREAIAASTTQDAAEAPQTADEIQTTDNTPAIMETVEKAHQSRYSARQTAPLTFAIWDNVKNAPIIETTSTGIMAYMEIFGIDRIEPATIEAPRRYFKVTYQHSEYVWCTNIAHAVNAADVEREYSNHANVTIREADAADVEEARRKGMPIVECEHVEPEPAETIPTTEAEPAPISDDERRAALDRLNHEQNAANLFTNISPTDVDNAVMMGRANATTTTTAYSRPAYDWTQDNDTANATSGAGTPRTAQAV